MKNQQALNAQHETQENNNSSIRQTRDNSLTILDRTLKDKILLTKIAQPLKEKHEVKIVDVIETDLAAGETSKNLNLKNNSRNCRIHGRYELKNEYVLGSILRDFIIIVFRMDTTKALII